MDKERGGGARGVGNAGERNAVQFCVSFFFFFFTMRVVYGRACAHATTAVQGYMIDYTRFGYLSVGSKFALPRTGSGIVKKAYVKR